MYSCLVVSSSYPAMIRLIKSFEAGTDTDVVYGNDSVLHEELLFKLAMAYRY